jgi:hypothetical protein
MKTFRRLKSGLRGDSRTGQHRANHQYQGGVREQDQTEGRGFSVRRLCFVPSGIL